jgi:hypothetical protein
MFAQVCLRRGETRNSMLHLGAFLPRRQALYADDKKPANRSPGTLMARYLHRNCRRCHGCLGVVVSEPGRNIPLQSVNGHCGECGYRFAWIVIRGKKNQGSTTRFRENKGDKLLFR